MTIDTQTSKVQYTGNGAAKTFAVPFKVIEAGHLRLVLYENEQESEVGGGYTVNGAGSGSVSVTLDKPLPAGVLLTIMRRVPLLQPTDLQNGGDFNADVLEASLDYLEMQIQQNSEAIDRAVKLIVSSSETSEEYAEEIFQAHGETLKAADRAETAAKKAETSAGYASAAAQQAREDANRAAALVDPASLASGVFNVRKPFVLENPVKAGTILTLPGYYFPARDVLWLGFEGTVCTPRKSGVEWLGEYQYSEVGDDPDRETNEVTLHFDAPAGSVFDMWVVSSAVGANIDAIAALAEESAGNAGQAAASAASALKQAEIAKGAATQAVEIVDEAVQRATAEARAQADRAEAGADRAMATVGEAVRQATVEAKAQADRAEAGAGRVMEIVDEAVAQAATAAGAQADRARSEADRAYSYTQQLPDVTRALDGQVLVARSVGGKMQAGYENAPSAVVKRLDVTLSAALAARAAFTVPLYVVGSGKLQIYFDGVLCAPGTGAMYQESGAGGTQSTSIIFNESLPAGSEITALATS